MNQQSPQQQSASQSQGNQKTQASSHKPRPRNSRKMSPAVIAALITVSGTIVVTLISIIAVRIPPSANPTPSPSSTSTLRPTAYPPTGWGLVINDTMIINNGNWSTDKRPDGSICHFSGGGYQITQETLGYSHYCRMGTEKYTNFAFEVQMMIIKGDQGGIYFRSSDESNISCYYFHINSEGGYVFDIYDNNRSKPLVNGTDTTAIRTGFNQPNLIAVVAQGNKFYLYVNKQLITVVVDQNNSYGSGYIGLTADALDKPTEVLYSNLKMWTQSSS